MFRSLMTIISELYLYLTTVIFMLKHSVKLRRYIYNDVIIYIYIYIYMVMWQHVVERHVCCVLCTAHNTHAALRHLSTYSLYV